MALLEGGAQLSDTEQSGRKQQLSLQEHMAKIVKDSNSAAWLCELCLHGKETSTFKIRSISASYSLHALSWIQGDKI